MAIVLRFAAKDENLHLLSITIVLLSCRTFLFRSHWVIRYSSGFVIPSLSFVVLLFSAVSFFFHCSCCLSHIQPSSNHSAFSDAQICLISAADGVSAVFYSSLSRKVGLPIYQHRIHSFNVWHKFSRLTRQLLNSTAYMKFCARVTIL